MKHALSFVALFEILISNPLPVAAQQIDSVRRPVIVKTSLFEPLNIFTFPTWQAAVEVGLSRSVSAQFGVGSILYRPGVYEDSIFLRPIGFKTQLQFRNYKWLSPKTFATRKWLRGGFVGLDMFYNYERFNTVLKYGVLPDTIVFSSYDGFGVVRRKYGANAILGYQWPSKNTRWAADFYSGFGIAHKRVRNISREFDPSRGDVLDKYNYRHDIFGATESRLTESSGIKVNFVMDLLLRYTIR